MLHRVEHKTLARSVSDGCYHLVSLRVITCGQVNGVSLVSATHYQAVAAIKLASNDMTIVVVKAAALPNDGLVCIVYLFIYLKFVSSDNK